MKQLWEMTLVEFMEVAKKGQAHGPGRRDQAGGTFWLRGVEHGGCAPEDVARTYIDAADNYCGSPRTGYWWYLRDAFFQGRISAELLRTRDRQIFAPDRLRSDEEREQFELLPHRKTRAAA